MAQPASTAEQTLPEDVAALAAAEGLGALKTIVRPARIGTPQLVGYFALAVLSLALFVLPAFYVGWYIWQFPNLNRKQAARRVYLFQGGIVVTDAAGPVGWFRWDSMTALQELTRKTAYGIKGVINYKYTLYKTDGTTVKLTGFFENPAAWGKAIQEEITRAQLPGVLETVENGGSASFGDVTVTKQGISSTKRGALRWDEVQRIYVYNGSLGVVKDGKRLSWSSVQVKKIPNFFLCLAAVDRLSSGKYSTARR